MEQIILSDYSFEEIYKQLYPQIGGQLIKDHHNHIYTVSSNTIRARCKGISFSNSISFLSFRFFSKVPLKIQLQSSHPTSSFYFLYCNEGHILHKTNNKNNYRRIHQYQTAAIKTEKKEICFLFPQKQTLEVIFIKIHPKVYLKKEKKSLNLKNELKPFFTILNHENEFAHYGHYNLKVSEIIEKIGNIKEEGILKNIFLEGQIKLLLALFIKQFKEEVKNSKITSNITNDEIQKIKEISHYIKKFPESSDSIKQLTIKYGLTALKLQNGFKLLFGRTVTDYKKNIRIETAEDIIKTGEYTISEIVYKIGFTNKSYFSKIFKEKYGCSPKEYQNKIKKELQNNDKHQ